jgi:hypothetical protein
MYNRDKQWRRIPSAETFNWIATASLKIWFLHSQSSWLQLKA